MVKQPTFNFFISLAIVTHWHSILVFATSPRVKLGHTELIGLAIEPHHQEFYGGIPYAEPPIAELRFQPPVLKKSLGASVFDAESYGRPCLQLSKFVSQNASVTEDCLTINVVRPADINRDAGLPVMAWIYGRGFYGGDSASYNGSEIVARSMSRDTPVIYVDFNYRVGPLGFPQGQEAYDRGILNIGLKDQLAALGWIQHNIHHFGGDKNKVTIFGESSGSISIGIHLLNPDIDRLARSVIFTPASPPVYNATVKPNRVADWQNFVAAIPECASVAKGEDTLPCLQNASTDALYKAFNAAYAADSTEPYPFSPTIDGPDGLLPDLPSRLWKKGRFSRLPFIAGNNQDQGTGFSIPNATYSEEAIRQILVANYTPSEISASMLEAVINRTLELYPADPSVGCPFDTGNDTFGLDPGFKRISAIDTDVLFTALRRQWTQTTSNAGVDAWNYVFADPQNVSYFGATHHSEVDYVFGALNNSYSTQESKVSPLNLTSATELSAVMQDYWISFATSLDPNDGKGGPRPHWGKYTPKSQNIMQLDSRNTTMISDNFRERENQFIMSNSIAFLR